MTGTPDTPNGDGYAYNFDRRLDRINDAIQSLLDAYVEDRRLFHDTMVEMNKRHIETMEEIRELILLQREQRIDIMALFSSTRENRERLEKKGL